MTDLASMFSHYKPKALEKQKGNRAVKYTRVSTKKQMERNQSLFLQDKYINDYAAHNSLQIVASFGGSNESAKSDDDRREFSRMMEFIKHNEVHYILVDSYDRFSRTGINAITIIEALEKEHGITVISASNPIDTSTTTGDFQQDLLLLFANFMNKQHRDRVIRGTREVLRRGRIVGKAPLGYDQETSKNEQRITVNSTGEALKQAFRMKLDGKDNATILLFLRQIGTGPLRTLNHKRLFQIFENPFYAGILVRKLLDYEPVQGTWEPLVAPEDFLKIQGIHVKRSYKIKENDTHLPLRRFLYCTCGGAMVGYIVKKKGLYYYKCNYGCHVNKSAKALHALFEDKLSNFIMDERYERHLKIFLNEVLLEASEGETQKRKSLGLVISNLKTKIQSLKDRHVEGELDKDIFKEYMLKYGSELMEAESELKGIIEVSNPDKAIEKLLELSYNLKLFWQVTAFETRQELQKLIFPEGLIFDKGLNDYRTSKINEMFLLLHTLSPTYKIENKEKHLFLHQNSPLVVRSRLLSNHKVNDLLSVMRFAEEVELNP